CYRRLTRDPSRPRPTEPTNTNSSTRLIRALARCTRSCPGCTLLLTPQRAVHTDQKEDDDDPGDNAGRGSRPVREDLQHEGCGEAQAARVEGLDGLPRPERGRSGLGDLRLGPGRLGKLRLRSRGAADHAGGRPQGQAAGRRAGRPVRRVSLIQENVAVVRRGYRAFNDADLTALA